MGGVTGKGGWTAYCEECAKDADHDGEEDYEEEAESGAFVAGSLGIDDGEGEGSIAADDGCQVVDAVEDCDGVEEGCYDD